MAQGIDSEYDCTQYAHQIAEKYTFVGRYYRMPPPYSHYPTLTRLEAQALSAAGLSLASIWEYISGSQGRIESLNYNAGLNEGGRAYKQALALPQPDGTPIYFAVDEGYDPQKPEYAGPIDDYFKGVNDAFAQAAGPGNQPKYAIGVYGTRRRLRMAERQGEGRLNLACERKAVAGLFVCRLGRQTRVPRPGVAVRT